MNDGGCIPHSSASLDLSFTTPFSSPCQQSFFFKKNNYTIFPASTSTP
jgi:hypothetical protein